ncbi:MAG: hypothetical protein IKT23_02500 [Clostridia bacterium]|nr:hypothetical protein [Clostridia bacterium]MBR6498542.1 hypothetical protein [Clostridia bacterium]
MKAASSAGPVSAALLSGAVIMRNYSDVPFPQAMSGEQKAETEDRVVSALAADFPGLIKGRAPESEDELLRLDELAEEAVFRAEQTEAYGTGLILDTRHPIRAVVNRREHLLLSATAPGADTDRAYSLIKPLERAFSNGGEPAFDRNWGYLTSTVLYSGNAFVGWCLMNLKGLWQLERNKDIVKKLNSQGFILHPLFAKVSGNLHVLFNKKQLGETTSDIIRELEGKASELSEMEADSLEELIYDDVDRFTDEVTRALGVMLNARIMSYRELLDLYTVLRAGLLTGFMDGDCGKLDAFVQSMSPRAMREKLGILSEREEELTRAETARSVIAQEIKTNIY